MNPVDAQARNPAPWHFSGLFSATATSHIAGLGTYSHPFCRSLAVPQQWHAGEQESVVQICRSGMKGLS